MIQSDTQRAAISGRRRILKKLLIWTPLTVLAALLVFSVTPLGRYLLRAALAEAQILLARRPIESVIADTSTSDAQRKKLLLVVDARRYAIDSLGLKAGKSFTQFTQLDRDTLVLVLSASPKDWLAQYTWWFPVVGHLPYKGYFDYEKGRAEAAAMASRGYDTNLRPASAFSTLGWFNDPLLSTTLASDSVDLVDTVIHELTHNTLFLKNQGAFNESFANFVGSRGAAAFFLSRGDSVSAREATDRWDDQQVLGRYWAELYSELDSVFRANAGDSLKPLRLALRDSVYAAARREMVDGLSKELKGVSVRYLEVVKLDNASLVGRRVYATDLDLFDAVLRKEGGSMTRAIAAILEVVEKDPERPYEALKTYMK